jgi:mRNA-degrading endonuclease RelE of RelBE toxin-antitoxin system
VASGHRYKRVIGQLAENPYPGPARQLVNDSSMWRVRAGDWRILDEVNKDRLIVLILDAGHGSEIY